MIFIKCLDLKRSRLFFIISELPESEHEKLIFFLIDMKIKMKASSREEMDNQNPFLQEYYSVYHFTEVLDSVTEIKRYLGLEENVSMKAESSHNIL